MKKEKTLSERLREMLELYRQLENIGIHKGLLDEMNEFYEDANQFVKHKIEKVGMIGISSINRILYYELILYGPKPSNILLKHIS